MTSETIDTKLPPIEPGLPMQNLQQSGLTGPSYSITGHADKFKLPPTKILKPGVEHHPGQLDSWPVHSLNPAHSNLSMGRNSSSLHSSQHQRSSTTIKPSIQLKPKFLEQLESYLSKELRLLGCPPTGPHELRLQAYREVFEYLIEDFKTYKGLLSAIKNEYELYLDYQEEIIKELKPMRTMLDTMREECERKVMEMKGEEKHEEAEVRQENKRLMAVIDKMKSEELSYKAQIEKLQEEVAELYTNYRHECDARKILISEYNDLKFRQQEQKTEDDGTVDEREDPVVLKLKLARAREDLRASNQKVNTMLADYWDVVPRREFEALEATCRNLETDVEKLKTDHGALMDEHRTLQDLYNGLQAQKDKATSELADLKRSATPRPDWGRCGLYIEGGPERWTELSEGRSSDGILNILLAQMAGMDESQVAKGDPFVGRGMEDTVPRYLRAEGSVKNRKLTLTEVNELINGFWHHRLNSVQDPPFQLDEDLFYFLLSRNENNEEMAIEDGYNLHDAFSRFVHKPHVMLFKQIIGGELEETVFHYWLHLQTSLTEEFSKQQVGQGMVKTSMLPQILETALPWKLPESIKVLSDNAIKLSTVSQESMGFVSLFSPDTNGSPSEFSMLLLEQYQAECEEFVVEIANVIQDKEVVSLNEIQGVFHKLDGSKSYGDQLLLLAKAFSVSLEIISEDRTGLREITTPAKTLLKQLRKLGVCKASIGSI